MPGSLAQNDDKIYIDAFRKLWDSINTKPRPVLEDGKIVEYVSCPWGGEAEIRTHRGKPWVIVPNPWVWTISFRMVQ